MKKRKVKDIDAVCEKWLGYKTRGVQKPAIQSIIDGNNTIVIAPTGLGKTAVFTVAAMMAPAGSMAVIFSPLISLMKDMVKRCKEKGIPAARVSGDQSEELNEKKIRRAGAGKYRMLFVAPERLKNKSFVEMTKKIPISFVAIDEMHVISQWSAAFRPAYMEIIKFIRLHDNIPTLGLTATADKEIEVECARALGLKQYTRFIVSPRRDDLKLTSATDLPIYKLTQLLRDEPEGARIVYCSSRKGCDALAHQLKLSGLEAEAYHAGLMKDQRDSVQERFMMGRTQTIVATNAFGMGIDKRNVRAVVHWHIPGSIYAYSQEVGRGSRDGKGCLCLLNVSGEGKRLQRFFITIQNPKLYVYQRLWEYFCKKIDVKESLRTTEGILWKVGGCPEAMSGWAMSALRFMEYNRLVSTLPGDKVYELPVVNRVLAREYADRLDCEIRENVLIYTVGPDQMDRAQQIVRSGAVASAPPRSQMVIKRLSKNMSITESMIREKLNRDDRKYQDVLDFSVAPDKAKFIEDYFTK